MDILRERLKTLSPHPAGKARRLLAAFGARSLGYGGISRVSEATGVARSTIGRGLKDAGVSGDRIYEDRTSGRRDHRLGLDACLKALQSGNALVIWKLDRIGRDLKHLAGLVDGLRGRGVGLRVLSSSGTEIDTASPNGRLVFGSFASLADFERELITGGGRLRKMDLAMLKMAMAAMASLEASAQDLAQWLGITTTTLYAYAYGNGAVKAPGQKLLDAASIRLEKTPERRGSAPDHDWCQKAMDALAAGSRQSALAVRRQM